MVTRIGVNTATAIQSSRSNPGTPSGRYQIAGVTAQGPTGSRVVRSLGEFVSVYGPRTSFSTHMHDAAALFFSEGGSELVVTRVVGPAATRDAVTIKDTAPTPKDVVKLEALHPGASNLAVRLSAPAGKLGSWDVTVLAGGVVVESWAGVLTYTDMAARAEGSAWVRAVVLDTSNQVYKPVFEEYYLVGGKDDRANITAAHVADALNKGGDDAVGGALAAPGYPAEVMRDHLPAIAAARRQIVLLSAPQGATNDQAATLGQTLIGMENADRVGLFHPWVSVPDGGRRRLVDPVSYVAAVRARSHLRGYWSVPAGEGSRAQAIVGTASVVDVAANDTLAGAQVNGLVTVAGQVRLYGWQSLSRDPEVGLLSTRDTLNGIELAAQRVLEPYLFSRIDGRGYLQSRVQADVEGVLAPLAQAGALFARVDQDGETVDPGYRVTVDGTVNPLDALARNELSVLIAVRLSPLAQLINVEIVKVPLSAAL